MHTDNNFESLRDGVRSVVSQFDSRYWQEIDEARAFPEKFVNALTSAGWLSALIPEEYGGSNLSLVEASSNVVMTRTFSKIYGMAGQRLGYGIAQPELARTIAMTTRGGGISRKITRLGNTLQIG